VEPEPLLAEARAAALKALAIDQGLPEAHAALALIVENRDLDWQTSGKEFRRAIELNPNYATAHHWYAEYLTWQGHFDEALKESERARQLDPLSLIIAADNGAILYYARQYDRAIAKWESVLGIDAEFSRADLIIAAYAERGRFTGALARVEHRRPSLSAPIYWCELTYVYGRSGQMERARDAFQEILQTSRNAPLQAGMLAWAASGLRDKELTLSWLEKALADRSNETTNLKVNPTYDFVRGDPRFQRLLDRVGLAQ
jgi:tetratricopeptide (TPR) repeat protein